MRRMVFLATIRRMNAHDRGGRQNHEGKQPLMLPSSLNRSTETRGTS
jgi:hypothetical protein